MIKKIYSLLEPFILHECSISPLSCFHRGVAQQMLNVSNCGTAKVIACIEDPVVIKKILMHLEEKAPTRAALLLPDSRAPPQSSLFG